MNGKEHARAALAYLDEVCDELKRSGRLVRTRRSWWQQPGLVAMGLALGLYACSDEVTDDSAGEICDNGEDDDGDGDVDCADSLCINDPLCPGTMYGVPTEICDNGADDDGDGAVDCADGDCIDFPSCGGADYMAPFEICDNGVDDDGDNLADCADPDCAGSPGC